MRVSMRIQGGADLAKRLRQLPQSVSARVQRDALMAGAEPIRAEAAKLAPRDDRASAPHLADNIVIASKTREGDLLVEVGPSKQPSDHFYGYFQEYGTAHHPAQPFMRPAFDAKAAASLNTVLDRLWASIRKALALGGGVSTTGRNL